MHVAAFLNQSIVVSLSVLEGKRAESPVDIVDVRDARPDPLPLEVLHHLRRDLCQHVLNRRERTHISHSVNHVRVGHSCHVGHTGSIQVQCRLF